MNNFYENLKVGPVFIVAELSANHNQDLKVIVQTIVKLLNLQEQMHKFQLILLILNIKV